MLICHSRYPCRLRSTATPGVYEPGEAVAVIEEEREADEWGNPGRLVRRRLLHVEGPMGGSWAARHRSKGSIWRLELGPRIGGLAWASGFGGHDG
ncbi:hypothetical protein RDV84_23185 [Lysobacter yananisis]|uniref:Uncharacterized protein n=1 Tax=Lysobacter yananisis TaxID=1003114 RepID=A0ABY9PAG0_9GAMM|nr:hypothetical protein [Lysobacter yananisis]WMT02832.1 hypothetical protein RDV84_23185 [Lysobacter yananisis]